ncbi:MAG: IS1182 family transposase [Clostridia bacterium]|nr:IS1182 family transposase [Clostridia bacterium]
MLKETSQTTLNLSNYANLYDILIAKNNFWRQLDEMVDFSFVYEELREKYSSTMGRKAEDVVRMFKYLLLKGYYKLSDRGLVERTKTDMLFKYFLGYSPEETELIDPSLLTVFRRERLSNKENEEETSTNLLDKLIGKTVEIALAEGLIEVKNKIIQDSTHTNARFQHISPREELIRQAKELRKSVYKIDESMHEKMPKKKESTGLLEDQIEYTKELLKLLKEDGRFTILPSINEQINYLEETMMDTEYEIEYSKDQDARIGHKTADTAFFGYKTHIAMTPERIITAATITSGEKHDGKQLQELVKKSQENGIKVEAVIGDGAYSEKENIEYCEENNIKLASKLSKLVTHRNNQGNSDFEYNKDAGMYVCKAGHMAVRKIKYGNKNSKDSKHRSEGEAYYFDVEKCKHCIYKEGCYKEGRKSKTYCVTIKNDIHIKHMDYMETEEFQKLYSERYKIEAKNAELKSNFGYDEANATGKVGITIQGATTLFLANMKRIIKLKEEKTIENAE